MASSINVDIDIYMTWGQSVDSKAYLTGVTEGMDLAEHMIEQGLTRCPGNLVSFFQELKKRSIAAHFLIVEIQKRSGVMLSKEHLKNAGNFLSTDLQSVYITGLMNAFQVTFQVRIEAYDKLGNGGLANVVLGKYLERTRAYIESLKIL